MIFNMTGGGGTALNFRVVGGTSTPSDPKENTIWVNTNATITDWVFSATQPAAANGRVWFSVGNSSSVEFDALKKNGIQVYPMAAKQYVNGAWVGKTAKTYQGGAWVDWFDGVLYDAGDQCTDVTGGWKGVTGNGNNYANVNSNTMNIVRNSSGNQGVLYTNGKVDVTGFKTLTVYFSAKSIAVTGYNGSVKIGLASNNTSVPPSFSASASSSATGAGEVTLDISTSTGSHYIGITADNMACTVTKVYLS